MSVRSLNAFECPIFFDPATSAAAPPTGAASDTSEARLLFLWLRLVSIMRVTARVMLKST